MAPSGLVISSILFAVSCSAHILTSMNKHVAPPVDTVINQKQQYFNDEISTADNQNYDLIGKEDKKKSDQVVTKKVRQKQQISYKPIFTTDSPGYNFISEEEKKSKIDLLGSTNSDTQRNRVSPEPILTSDSLGYNSVVGEDGNEKIDSVEQEQQISSQPFFTIDSPEHKSVGKNDKEDKINPPVAKNSNKQEERFSYEPIFTTDSQYINLNTEGKKDKKSSWGSTVKKLLSNNKKQNHLKLSKADEERNDSASVNVEGNKEWNFNNNPFVSSETDNSDTESTNSSKSWSKLLKKIWSSGSSSSSGLSSSSSSPLSETDIIMNKLLDEYNGETVNGEVVEPAVKSAEIAVEAETEELPIRPVVPLENFSLCSEVYSGEIDVLDIFSDGKAPTCVFACLYYKIKHSVFVVRPEGRCSRLSAHGPGVGTAPITEVSCVCKNGVIKNKFRYKIIQQERTLYYVHDPKFGLFLPLGTVEEIFDYVETHFRQYLKDFLKDKRGIDWKGMYEYVRDLRWNRHDLDDRPVSQYLSDSLKEEINDIKAFWTVGIHTYLLRLGNHRTRTW